MQNLAWISFVQGQSEEAEQRLDASATAFGELGDWGGMSWALGLLAWVKFTQGRLDEASVLAERILRDATELGNRWAAAIMRVLTANIALWSGEPATALERATEARAVFQELGDAWGELQSVGPATLALNALLRTTEASQMADEADEIAQQVPDGSMRQLATVLRVAISVHAGDPEAYRYAFELVEGLQKVDERFLSDEQHTLWGMAQLQHGDVDAALATLRSARDTTLNRGPRAAADVALAAALVAAGEPAKALETCTEADELAVTFVDRYRADVARAFALHRLGDAEGSAAALGKASATVDGTHSLLDQFVVRLARAALEHQAPADEQRLIGWETAFALMAGTPG